MAILLFFKINRSYYLLFFLLVWFPLENLILLHAPIGYYAFVKYFPEVLLALTFLASIYYHWRVGSKRFTRNILFGWLVAYALVAIISLFLNQYSPTVWVLGIRQILRFALVYFIVWFEDYDQKIIKKILLVGGAMILFEAIFGIVQYALGGVLDRWLFFFTKINIGGAIDLEGGEQFWAPGTRAYATLGRYDRLGSFLTLGFLFGYPWLYYFKDQVTRFWLSAGVAVVAGALILTYSRASWLAFGIGLIVIGYYVWNDKRILQVGLAGVLAIALLLGFVAASRGLGATTFDASRQSISDRVLELFDFYSYEQSYEGYGRIFFIVNTPLVVARAYPFFGVGPGNYGGGVAAALRNDTMYDRLHLPFGIQNVYGQIDNNWWSILGETGGLGLICWVGIFGALIKASLFIFRNSKDNFNKVYASGFIGVTAAVSFMGFFGPYFEFRSLMFYFWLGAGILAILWRREKVT